MTDLTQTDHDENELQELVGVEQKSCAVVGCRMTDLWSSVRMRDAKGTESEYSVCTDHFDTINIITQSSLQEDEEATTQDPAFDEVGTDHRELEAAVETGNFDHDGGFVSQDMFDVEALFD